MLRDHDTAGPDVPRRAIHLDFHTGPAIRDVARDFDPVSFTNSLAEAHVDSVTVFAKCHHGHLYFDTDHPARHPGLPAGLDLLGEQVAALHEAGISAPVYLSVQCDEFAADEHPEWIALGPDGRQVKWAPDALTAGWRILDMSSPYQDYVADQLDLVLRTFAPVDGMFLDMCWDQPSVGRWAVDSMRRSGLNPADPADRARHARAVAHSYMARYRDMINAAQGRARPASIFFNSRPRTLAGQERHLATHVEIEALPTGGWGYAYAPYVARYIRSLGLPATGLTGRFQRSWGDNASLKAPAALHYECCQLLSLGLGVSIGDVLHPKGRLDPAAYELVGSVYEHLAACEPHLDDTTIATEVAVLANPEREGQRGPDTAQLGAVRVLQQLNHQFDVVAPGSDLSAYRLAVVPESTILDPAARDRLSTFTAAGGAVLLAGPAATAPDGGPLLDEQKVLVEGESPYTHTFVRLNDGLASGAVAFDTVMYERGLRLRPAAGATVLAQVVEPYFERSWDRFCGHSYTPPNRLSPYAAIVANERVITVAFPLFVAIAKHGNLAYRDILGGLLDRLLPDPLLRTRGPAHLETAVAVRGDTTVVHLLSFIPSRQGELDIISDPFPLVDVPVSVRRAEPPASVTLQPSGQRLDFEHRDGYVHTQVTVLDGHALLVVSA